MQHNSFLLLTALAVCVGFVYVPKSNDQTEYVLLFGLVFVYMLCLSRCIGFGPV